MDNGPKNIDNSAGNNNSNPSIDNGGQQNLFSYIHENPDAKVILNRGSVFENDITDWVMSFSTSNSVDDIIGSFNVVLNNENDRFVDRYNNVKIAEASAIEIFARTSNAGKGESNDNNPATNSDTIIVPEKLLKTNAPAGFDVQNTVSVNTLINEVIKQQYGDVSPESRTYYEQKIRQLNATRVVSFESMSDPASDAMFGDAVVATDSNGNQITKAIQITPQGTLQVVQIGGGPDMGEGDVTTASAFFEGVKGRVGQSAFFITDLVIDTDGIGGFVKNPNNTYKFKQYSFEGRNDTYPLIRPELVSAKENGTSVSNTVFRPTIKTVQVPFLKNDDGSDADNVILTPGEILRVPPMKAEYRRIFFGVVINISQNIVPGSSLTISLSGKSLGYWLEASVINTHPAVEQAQLAGAGGDLTYFANKYADSSALDVFRDLIRFSTDDLVTVTDYSIDTNQVGVDYLLTSGANTDPATDGQGRVLLDANGNPIRYSSNPLDKETQLLEKKEAIYQSATPFDGFSKLDKSSNPNNTNHTAWQNSSKAYAAAKKDFEKFDQQYVEKVGQLNAADSASESDSVKQNLRNQLSEIEKRRSSAISAMDKARATMDENPVVKAQTDAIQHNLDQNSQQFATQLKAGRSKLLDETGISKHWQRIFSQLVLEILDGAVNEGRTDIIKKGFLANVHPFRWEISAPGWMDGDYQTKADIGRTVAQNIMYEFYFDTNGHFVLKPPLYSITNEANNADYILTDKDIYSININDTLEGIITRVDITGAFYESPSTPREMIYNTYQDFNLIKNYGVQSRQVSNLLFVRNNADCRAFGRAFMSKNNVELKNATVTIYGRPEIRLGTSIYLQPRDTVYYIKSISHDFTVGDGITTTLTLVGARRIIRGFRAKKTVKQYYKILQPDGTFRIATTPTGAAANIFPSSAGEGSGNSLEIEHFIPLNATNFSNIPLSSQATVNDELNAQLNVDNTGEFQQKLTDDRVVLLQNVYTITSHPNLALIGLIVSEDSATLKQINKNYYNFLANLPQYAENQFTKGAKELSPNNPTLITPAAKQITEAFNVFVGNGIPAQSQGLTDEEFLVKYGFTKSSINYGTTAAGAPTKNALNPESFTYTLLNFFMTSQYKKIQNQVEAGIAAKDRQVYLLLDVQRSILDLLIKDIDALGSYTQYTDVYGREFPSYVDFGKSMTIFQTDLALSSAQTRTPAALKSEQERLAAATKAATKALGRSSKSPNTSVKPIDNSVGVAQSQIIAAPQNMSPTIGSLNGFKPATAIPDIPLLPIDVRK
jgi:hypothetical protein